MKYNFSLSKKVYAWSIESFECPAPAYACTNSYEEREQPLVPLIDCLIPLGLHVHHLIYQCLYIDTLNV
jgi:hypothetical protein